METIQYPAAEEGLGRLWQAELASLTATSLFPDRGSLASVLKVDESRIPQWTSGTAGQGFPADTAWRIGWAYLVASRLLQVYLPETARQWLQGRNPLLGGRQPLALLQEGMFEEVLGAIEQDDAHSYA